MDPAQLVRLVLRAKAGEPAAFAALVGEYGDRIYAFCYRYLRSRARAQELAQDTWLKVVEQIQTLKSPTSFVAWLYQIARNLCHDELVKQKRQAPLTEETLAVIADCGESPEENLDKMMQRRRVAQAISRLSADHQDVLILIHYEQVSYEAAADVLGIETGTVKSRLSRALQKLREQLDRVGGEP